MDPENDDVKQDDDSSTSNDQQDDKQDDSSTSQEVTQATGLDKIVNDAVKASQTQDEGDETKKADATEKKEDGKTDEKKADEKGPVPYERFNEVITAKNVAEQQLNDMKPLADHYLSIHTHCEANNISPDEFRYWMNVAALSKSDPAKALEVLQPQLQQFQSFTGDALPPDLKAAVEAGEIKLEHAKRLVAAENKTKFGQQQQQVTMQQLRQQQEQQLAQSFQSALGAWISTKKGTDPDFVPKSSENDPDGKFELFLHKLDVDARRSGIKSAADLVALAEKVLTSVNTTVGRFSPKPPNGSKVIRSTNARSTSIAPKTFEEAISAGAAKAGIAFTPNKS